MDNDELLNQLTPIFREVFRDDSILVTPTLTSKDVERWDSLSHIDMVSMVEEHFGIQIPGTQVLKLRNVGELCSLINSLLNHGKK